MSRKCLSLDRSRQRFVEQAPTLADMTAEVMHAHVQPVVNTVKSKPDAQGQSQQRFVEQIIEQSLVPCFMQQVLDRSVQTFVHGVKVEMPRNVNEVRIRTVDPGKDLPGDEAHRGFALAEKTVVSSKKNRCKERIIIIPIRHV